MKKRILCILLAAAALAALAIVPAAGETGYQASDWAKNELAKAEEAGLIPEPLAFQDLTKPITRREYAAAAVALYDKLADPDAAQETAAGQDSPFTDVDDAYVTLACRLGLVQGVGNGKYDPDGTLTREQAATILARILERSGLDAAEAAGMAFAELTDTDTISGWARQGAAQMVDLGVIQGKPDGQGGLKFDPRGTLTGQEALVMNQRLAEQAANLDRAETVPTASFNGDFFAAVQSDEPNKSLSPVSARYALGLLQAGAAGKNRDQLDALLSDMDVEAWNKALASKEGGPAVEVANSIWFDSSVTPDREYLNAVQKLYDAESQTLDLTAQSAVNTINQWVKDKTHGLISSILDQPLSDDAAAVLLNALYFKGDWAVPFDAADTWDQTFHNQNGTERKVPFMHDTRRGLTYISTDTCVGTALRYRGDGSWCMLFLMPKPGENAGELAGEDFAALLANAGSAYVRLSLPKFTIEGSYDLTQPLKDLGLTAAFAGGDFTPMGTCTKGPIQLSKVIQKTYLRVDEEGTEAAAVTGAVMEAGAALNPEEPIELTFDRPFLCCLWNGEIGQPLFLTVVNQLG